MEMDDFNPIRIKQNRGPTLEFDGRLIAEMSTFREGKSAWNENALWETPSGKWVLEIRQCSDREGQMDFVDAHVFDQADMGERQIAVMDALNWEFGVQRWAKKMGWELARRVD